MSEDRAGQGAVYSSTELKDNLGRTSFRRVAKDHVGTRSNPTEWAASRRLEKGRTESNTQHPTLTEMRMVFEDNPSDVRTFRAAGMSDADIFEALRNR